MRHVHQGDNTNLCGQCCIASFLDISLKRAIRKIKKKGRTTTRDLCKALKIKNGRLKPSAPTQTCLISVKEKGSKNWHWILKNETTIMDPELKNVMEFDVYLRFLELTNRIISSHVDLGEIRQCKFQ